jgi:hypothetical protein
MTTLAQVCAMVGARLTALRGCISRTEVSAISDAYELNADQYTELRLYLETVLDCKVDGNFYVQPAIASREDEPRGFRPSWAGGS